MIEVKPFRFWCQKVLPVVYDDSLSYYELLCKVVDALNKVILNDDELIKAFAELKEWVEHYFDSADFQRLVNEKLDEMAEDGTLSRALRRPLNSACAGWVGFSKGFNVAKNGVVFTISHYETVPIGELTETQTGGYWYTDTITIPVDVPLYRANIVISTDIDFWNVHAVNYNPTNITFKLGTSVDYDTPPETIGVRIIAQARRPIPSSLPINGFISGATGNQGALDCAKSFLNARINGRVFKYGPNFMYKSSDKVNDQYGNGLVECDNIVMMALLGIDYAHSPYAVTTPDATFDFDNLVVNPQNLYPWTARTTELVKKDNNEWVNGFDDRIVDTSGICWWMWDNGYIFSDKTQAQNGDIVIFRRLPDLVADGYNYSSFDNVGHVGVIERDGSDLYVIHATVGEWTGEDVIVRTLLDDDFYNLSPYRYRPEDTIFARINFSTPE